MTSSFMKMISFIGLFAGISSLANAQTSYPIKCRPGSNTSFNLAIAGELRFSFNKAPVAAGNDGSSLQPGQCSWVDRPLNANEPASITVRTGPNFKVGVVVPHALNGGFKPYIYAEKQQWVYNFQQTDTILTLYVYNENGLTMVAPNP